MIKEKSNFFRLLLLGNEFLRYASQYHLKLAHNGFQVVIFQLAIDIINSISYYTMKNYLKKEFFMANNTNTIEPIVNIQNLIDDAKCYETIRKLRWPDEIVSCPRCGSENVIKHGHHNTEHDRRRYLCKGGSHHFDDLSDTIFEGHHQPLRVWILCLYFMGLNLSNRQIAKELELNESDVQNMTTKLREGVTKNKPKPILKGEVESDEV